MKKSVILLTAVVIIASVFPAPAQDSVLPPNADKKLIEDNLFTGLASGNRGLKHSCALMLGQIKSDRAVIPLIEVLHNNPDPYVRIAAAWALCRIGDARGVYAVKTAVKFDESSRVQATCAWYYDNLVKRGTFTFSLPEPAMVATAAE
jgi:HEAT repeat protein